MNAGLLGFRGMFRGEARSGFLYTVEGKPLVCDLGDEWFIRFTYADRWDGGRPPPEFVLAKVRDLLEDDFKGHGRSDAQQALREIGWSGIVFEAEVSRRPSASSESLRKRKSKATSGKRRAARTAGVGCPDCKQRGAARACGNLHVYVVEVLDNRAKKLYVGKTNHTVECRFVQHELGRADYSCACFGPPTHRQASGASYLRNQSIVLRYDLFENWNPVDDAAAEGELAELLGAHWN